MQAKVLLTSFRWSPILPILLLLAVAGTASAQVDWWQRARQFRTRYDNVKTDLPEDQAAELAAHMDITANAYATIFAGLRVRRPAVLDVSSRYVRTETRQKTGRHV